MNDSKENISDKQQKKEKEKEKKKNKRRSSPKTGIYYSFLTIVLLFCLIQIFYGAILNIGKFISYKAKLATLEHIKNEAQELNNDLKTEKKVITSSNSLEGIARNNLKMAEDDEILVIINKKIEPKKSKKSIHLTLNNLFKKKKKNYVQIENISIPTEIIDE